MADARRLMELGVAGPLAKELVAQIATGGLEIGTTSTTAMAGNRVPTATIRGGVLLQSPIADSTATTVEDLVTDFNALLAALRAAGILNT